MVLTYHEIVQQCSPYMYSLTTEQLEEHLGVLRAIPDPPELTFDDGHTSFLRHAVPVLNRFGFRGTVFVTVGWTGARTGYLDWDELGEVVRNGHSVQAHGWTHQWLTTCSSAELDHELKGTRELLEDRLGVPVEALSLPDGRYNANVLKHAAASGYKQIYTSEPFDGAIREGEVMVIGRMMLRRHMTGQHILAFLEAEKHPLCRLRLEYKLKQSVRALMGDRLYHRVWRVLSSDSSRESIHRSYERGSGAEGEPV